LDTLLVAKKRGDLSERDAAVVRRNPLMPIRPEAGVAQRRHGALGQAAILEAAAAQDDRRFFVPARH
jgi:hypothetical protein